MDFVRGDTSSSGQAENVDSELSVRVAAYDSYLTDRKGRPESTRIDEHDIIIKVMSGLRLETVQEECPKMRTLQLKNDSVQVSSAGLRSVHQGPQIAVVKVDKTLKRLSSFQAKFLRLRRHHVPQVTVREGRMKRGPPIEVDGDEGNHGASESNKRKKHAADKQETESDYEEAVEDEEQFGGAENFFSESLIHLGKILDATRLGTKRDLDEPEDSSN